MQHVGCLFICRRLIDDLLDVARLQDGNVQFRRTRAAVSEVIEHAVETVRPLAAARNHTLIVSVPPAALDTIFDLYVQAGLAQTERSAGRIGLGLYLARLIVEGHGGVIRAFSAGPDCGSELIVRLPLQAPLAPCSGERESDDAAAAADRSLS